LLLQQSLWNGMAPPRNPFRCQLAFVKAPPASVPICSFTCEFFFIGEPVGFFPSSFNLFNLPPSVDQSFFSPPKPAAYFFLLSGMKTSIPAVASSFAIPATLDFFSFNLSSLFYTLSPPLTEIFYFLKAKMALWSSLNFPPFPFLSPW